MATSRCSLGHLILPWPPSKPASFPTLSATGADLCAANRLLFRPSLQPKGAPGRPSRPRFEDMRLHDSCILSYNIAILLVAAPRPWQFQLSEPSCSFSRRGPGGASQCSPSCQRSTLITLASFPPLEPSSPRLLAACSSLAAPIWTGARGRPQPRALTHSSRALTTGPSGTRRNPQMRKGWSRARRFKAAIMFQGARMLAGARRSCSASSWDSQ